MPLSIEQLGALHQAREILYAAGLLQDVDLHTGSESALHQLQWILDMHLSPDPHPVIKASQYVAPLVTMYTPDEIAAGANHVTWKSYVHGLVEHPFGAIIEYPQTGSDMHEAISHRFCVKPAQDRDSISDPKDYIQYSLGAKKGCHKDVKCALLCDIETWEPVPCFQVKMSCESQKL